MRAEILKMLLQAHANDDEDSFRKAALQLADSESAAGHPRVADDLRSIIGSMINRPSRAADIVDIGRARGELSDILEGGHREERLADIILKPSVRERLARVVSENRSRGKLEPWGVQPRRRLLFHGPPGCGKSLAAAVLAGEMSMPLMTVRCDGLFSRYLGATAQHLRAIFAEMPRRAGVYFFDEFDAVGKARGDSQDVGEMNRIVTAFLQLLDADKSVGLVVAATNHEHLLDRALWRRFDLVIPFEKPDKGQIQSLLTLRLGTFSLDARTLRKAVELGVGRSFAELVQACENAIRTMALDGRERLTANDLIDAFEDVVAHE